MEPYALCQIISAHGCMHGYENQKECVNARILKDPGERNGYPSSLSLNGGAPSATGNPEILSNLIKLDLSCCTEPADNQSCLLCIELSWAYLKGTTCMVFPSG